MFEALVSEDTPEYESGLLTMVVTVSCEFHIMSSRM